MRRNLGTSLALAGLCIYAWRARAIHKEAVTAFDRINQMFADDLRFRRHVYDIMRGKVE